MMVKDQGENETSGRRKEEGGRRERSKVRNTRVKVIMAAIQRDTSQTHLDKWGATAERGVG